MCGLLSKNDHWMLLQKPIKFAIISHTSCMMNGVAFYIVCPQASLTSQTQSLWRIECVTDSWHGLDIFSLGWRKPERSPSLIPFHFICFIIIISHFCRWCLCCCCCGWLEFHSQNLSWRTYGIALLSVYECVWDGIAHNRIVFPCGMPHHSIELHIKCCALAH